MSMRDAFCQTMSDLLDEDPRVALITADIGYGRFEAGGLTQRHPRRVINVGIREQAMIGVAAGMALDGFRPFVHSYAPFLVERPFEQIKLDLGHQGVGAVLVSVGASYDSAREGRTHQAPGDVALLSTLPGVEIHVPGHPDEVAAMMRSASVGEATTYIRLSDSSNSSVFAADGRIHPVRRGSRSAPTVLAIGPVLDPVLEAVGDLDVSVLYTSTVAPLDRAGLRGWSTSSLTVVEPYLTGTTLPAIVDALGDRPMRLCAIGVDRGELRRYGSLEEHRAAHGLDGAGIRLRLRRSMNRPSLTHAVAI